MGTSLIFSGNYSSQVRPTASVKPPDQKNLILKWEEKIMVKCDFGMIRGATCGIRTMAFFTTAGVPYIYCFDYCSKQWSELPGCLMLTSNFALVVINDLLTTVGGKKSSKLFSFREGDWLETVSYTHLTLPTTPYV